MKIGMNGTITSVAVDVFCRFLTAINNIVGKLPNNERAVLLQYFGATLSISVEEHSDDAVMALDVSFKPRNKTVIVEFLDNGSIYVAYNGDAGKLFDINKLTDAESYIAAGVLAPQKIMKEAIEFIMNNLLQG